METAAQDVVEGTNEPTAEELDALDAGDELSQDTASGSESAAKGNAWDNMPSLSELLEQMDAGKAKPSDDAGDADTDDEQAKDQSTGERDAATDDTDESKGNAKPAVSDSDAGERATRYTVQDKDGNRFEFELEPGTTIAFKADGKDVKVESMDQLVGLAEKGVHADRQLSTMGQEKSRLERSLGELKTQSEELLLKALFDRDARSALRKALAPFRDPEVRKGQEALAREAERTTAEKAQSEEQIAQGREEFWTGVGREMKSALPEFQYLTEEDAPEITTIFYANYETTFQQAVSRELAAGKSEAEATEAAQRAAFQSLDSANLRKAMQQVHARYEQRLGKGNGKKDAPVKLAPAKPATAADAAKATEAHNRHTDTKLAQRTNAPRLRSAGAAPVVTPPVKPAPTTIQGRETEIKGLFDKMRGE